MSSLYRSTFLSPSNTEIDMNNNQIFSAICNGTTITTYRIVIRKMDNTLLYDTGTITLGSPLYDKETLIHTITGGTVTYKGEVKWVLTVGNGSTIADSNEIPFWNFTIPAYTMTVPATITTKSYEFVATYSQLEGVSMQRFKFIWYDDSDEILQDSDWIYSANTRYTFDGFITGETYKVESVVTTEYNLEVTTGKKTFDILYSEPNLIIKPDVTTNNYRCDCADTSEVDVSWAEAVKIDGHSTGSINYVPDFIYEGDYGLHLSSGATVYWDVDIPLDFTCTFVLQLSTGFTGVFCKLTDIGVEYSVGYDGNAFYFDNNGIIGYGLVHPITINPFLVAIRPTDIYVRYLDILNTWGDLITKTWGDLVADTWEEIKYK